MGLTTVCEMNEAPFNLRPEGAVVHLVAAEVHTKKKPKQRRMMPVCTRTSWLKLSPALRSLCRRKQSDILSCEIKYHPRGVPGHLRNHSIFGISRLSPQRPVRFCSDSRSSSGSSMSSTAMSQRIVWVDLEASTSDRNTPSRHAFNVCCANAFKIKWILWQ